MKNQEDRKLSSLFQQLGNKNEKQLDPDLRLKDAVFSTIDATSLVADIVDLFTAQFFTTQIEVLNSISENEKKETIQEELKEDKAAFFKLLQQKMKNRE